MVGSGLRFFPTQAPGFQARPDPENTTHKTLVRWHKSWKALQGLVRPPHQSEYYKFPTKAKFKETGPSTGGDPYVSAAAALDQAQRSLSIAQAQLKTPTISVAVAEQLLDALRSEIVALKALVEKDRVEIEGLRKVAADATQALDLARSEAEERIRVAAEAAHDWERLALAVSVKKQRELKKEQEALAKGREVLNAQRTAFEADKKALVDDRTQFAQKLQDMSQLFRPNPHPATPEATTTPLAGTSTPDSDPKPPMGFHRSFLTVEADEADQDSANSRKRRRTSDLGSFNAIAFSRIIKNPYVRRLPPRQME
ncbi:hypothetical protein B0H11DRAFT_2210210 [Mycena galericulata]|nr:hypothetical protein B0H11DRAFT_2210210 [Mycena galericulata]